MQCPKCEYIMSAFDLDCPRCLKLAGDVGSKSSVLNPPPAIAPKIRKQTKVSILPVLICLMVCVGSVAYYFSRIPSNEINEANRVPPISSRSDQPVSVETPRIGLSVPPLRIPQVSRVKVNDSGKETLNDHPNVESGSPKLDLAELQRIDAYNRQQRENMASLQQRQARNDQALQQQQARSGLALQQQQENESQLLTQHEREELSRLDQIMKTYNALLSKSARLRNTSAYSNRIMAFAVGQSGNFSGTIPTGFDEAFQARELLRPIATNQTFLKYYEVGENAFPYLPDADLDFLQRPPYGPELSRLRHIFKKANSVPGLR